MVAKTSGTSGICFSIWTFYYADNGNVNDEIDIEFYGDQAGNNNVIYSSYISETSGTHVNDKLNYSINDGKYHSYRFDWHNDANPRVEYFIDNVKVATITSNIPDHDMKIWVGAWCPSWAGENVSGTYHMYVKDINYKAF